MKFKNRLIWFVLVTFFISCNSYRLQKSEGESVSVEKSSAIDSTLIEMYSPYKQVLDSSMNEVLNVSKVEMSSGSPEGILGNFVCDLSLEIGNRMYKDQTGEVADFVLLNNGGLRTFLPKGNITRKKIYELMPFENELVVVTLTPEKTAELFQYIGRKTVKNGTRKQGVPVSGNVKVRLRGKTPITVLVDSIPLRGRNYKIITSDYLANGGDYMSFFENPIKNEKIGIKLRDAILRYVIEENKKGNQLNSNLDQRISYVN